MSSDFVSIWGFFSEIVHVLLPECYQLIKIGPILSDLCKLLLGVPQGSVLGPLLFSLFTTPLSLVLGKHEGIKFHFSADDTKVSVHLSQKNLSVVFEQLNRYLDHAKEWMSTRKLELNPDKLSLLYLVKKTEG